VQDAKKEDETQRDNALEGIISFCLEKFCSLHLGVVERQIFREKFSVLWNKISASQKLANGKFNSK